VVGMSKISEPAVIKLIRLIAELDKIIFPDNPIQEIRIITKEEDNNSTNPPLCGYSKGDLQEKEHYTVFKHLDHVVWDVPSMGRHLYLKDFLKAHSWENFQPFTEEEFLIQLAAHEVRHRVQEHFKVSLFSPQYVEEIKRGKRAKDGNLEAIVIFLWMYYSMRKKSDIKEFDADVIGFLAAMKFHEGINLQDLAKLIKEDARKIWEGQTPPFLFFLVLLMARKKHLYSTSPLSD
jgi:hypothetical protein